MTRARAGLRDDQPRAVSPSPIYEMSNEASATKLATGPPPILDRGPRTWRAGAQLRRSRVVLRVGVPDRRLGDDQNITVGNRVKPPSSGNAITGHRTRRTHIVSAESRCRADNDHSTSALTARPVFATGFDNRSQTVVALCGASNRRWTTTVRRLSLGYEWPGRVKVCAPRNRLSGKVVPVGGYRPTRSSRSPSVWSVTRRVVGRGRSGSGFSGRSRARTPTSPVSLRCRLCCSRTDPFRAPWRCRAMCGLRR
jgi:hypothetical protein